MYLELRLLINSIKNTVRSPRRLIPMVLIAAWVGTVFIQSLLFLAGESGRPAGPHLEVLAQVPIETIQLIVFIFLSLGSGLVVYGAFSSGLMVFSIAHIDFLFPTPISRRKVLFFKLVKDYLRYGLWIAFFFFFIGSPLFGELGVSLMPLGLVSIAAIVALVLTVLNLAHTINIVFTFGYERLKAAAAAIKAAIALAVISAGGCGAYHYLRSGEGLASALSALEFPLLSAVFAPARWASELFLAPLSGVTPEQWGQLGLLWLLAIGSFVLLMSRNENVYEPSLGVSVRFARRRAAIRSKDFTDFRLTPLREKGVQRVRGIRIPPFGRGATAFLWKNLVLRYRLYRSQLALMAIVPLVIVVILARVVPAEYKRNVPFLLAYIVWALSLMAQAEFRLDLKYADVVKPMPIRAWKLMLAQVGSSALYLTAGAALFFGYFWLVMPETRGDMLIACAIWMPFLGFANLAAVSIPGLLYSDTRDPTQNYLCGLFSLLATLAATLPAFILASLVLFVIRAGIYAALATACAMNLLIGIAGIAAAGAIFRRFDPTSE